MVDLPKDSQRIAIMGRTGTGKTVAGLWHLSERDFGRMPWVIMNFKRDELLDSIPYVEEIGLNEIPKKPGLYQIHPHPQDKAGMEFFLNRAWEKTHIGIFVDEGYMIDPRSAAYNMIQTQGRSLKIPTITLTQRPVWMSRFIISEADFFQVLGLSDEEDTDVVKRFIPKRDRTRGAPHILDFELEPFHSVYHDVSKGRKGSVFLDPVPAPSILLEKMEDKLKRFRKIRAM